MQITLPRRAHHRSFPLYDDPFAISFSLIQACSQFVNAANQILLTIHTECPSQIDCEENGNAMVVGIGKDLRGFVAVILW